jgi:hypothetical protein
VAAWNALLTAEETMVKRSADGAVDPLGSAASSPTQPPLLNCPKCRTPLGPDIELCCSCGVKVRQMHQWIGRQSPAMMPPVTLDRIRLRPVFSTRRT